MVQGTRAQNMQKYRLEAKAHGAIGCLRAFRIAELYRVVVEVPRLDSRESIKRQLKVEALEHESLLLNRSANVARPGWLFG